MTRILFFGTHPRQFNGYSKVVYEISKCMHLDPNYKLTIFGFQNFHENANHRKDLPDDVFIYDAFANETPKTQAGFGISQVKEFVRLNKPDVCVVYNDMLVILQIVSQLKGIEGMNFKLVTYIDQVYLYQKKEYIDYVNKKADAAILFTKGWEDCIKKQGLAVPTHYLQHGFNKMSYYPIPKHIARQYFGIKPNDFVILNLNRNQPRKRWDVCLKAFAEIVSRHPNEPIKLVIATAVQGAWNLLEIFERELKKRDLTLEVGMKHLIMLDNPQRITDEETNILYNIADIGINTCDGEGFGLCNFEQAGIGIPQVVPRLGGFVDFFDDECAMLVDPKMAYYVDNTRDLVCGEALLCDYMDFVDAIDLYYTNKEIRHRHGVTARKKILQHYAWDDITNKLCDIVDSVTGKTHERRPKPTIVPVAAAPTVEEATNTELLQEVEKIDGSLLKAMAQNDKPAKTFSVTDGDNKPPVVAEVLEQAKPPQTATPEVAEEKKEKKDKKEKEKKDKKDPKKKKGKDKKALQKKLALLLAAIGDDESESESDSDQDGKNKDADSDSSDDV